MCFFNTAFAGQVISDNGQAKRKACVSWMTRMSVQGCIHSDFSFLPVIIASPALMSAACFLSRSHLIYRQGQFFQLCICNNVRRHNINQPSERADPHTVVNKAAL